MSALWFPDTTVLCNFAAVGRLNLLRDLLDGRGHWTEAIAYEVSRSARVIPALGAIPRDGWLGEPIAISLDESMRVEAIRVAALGGARADPLQHRGEAETCYVIRHVTGIPESVWITDDEAAYDFGGQLGILTWDTRTLVEHLIADGTLNPVEAFALLMAMLEADRSPRRPPGSPRELV